MQIRDTRPNEPCPCGSGKKYKKCCARLEARKVAVSRHTTDDVSNLFQAAVVNHQAGRFPEAEALYRQVLQVAPTHPGALHLLGVIAHQVGKHELAVDLIGKALEYAPNLAEAHGNLGAVYHALGRLDDAIVSFQRALAIKPDFADANNNLGVALQAQGRKDEATESFRKAIIAKPDHVDARNNLGVALTNDGLLDEAIACFKQTLVIAPDNADAHFHLGFALQVQGTVEEAIAIYRRALSISPNYVDAHYNLGLALMTQGELEEAVASHRRALLIDPNNARAHNNLGVALQAQSRVQEATVSFRQALSIDPNYADAHCNLGVVLQIAGYLDEAETCFRRAILLAPKNADAHRNLGSVLAAQGRLKDAAASFRQSIALNPNAGLHITSELLLPPIMGTRNEMLASRVTFERNLDRLIEEGVRLEDPVRQCCQTNFYLAFQGLNNRIVQQKIADFYEKACSNLLYVAPHCSKPQLRSNKIRIGFVTKFIYKHSVSISFSRIVKELARRTEFDVVLISSHNHEDRFAGEMYANFAGRHVHLPDNLARAREIVAELQLDILVYLDIGMDPLSYFLAYSRLARAQCVLGGHPDTTGIGNMDYYLSSEIAEPADAQSHYSERLVRLPMGVFYFERPLVPTSFKTREALGLPTDGRVYACPMALQKIHPDFDEAIARVLELDANGYVVLFEDWMRSSWKGLLESRFKQTIPDDVRNRILFLPWLRDFGDFISFSESAAVILDPFHFGIGSTAIATFSVGTPIVTKPGEFLRGRVGLFYCKLLDVLECVAADTEEYAQKAVAIATDNTLRDRLKAKILANSHVLFDNRQPIEDLTDFFIKIGRST